MARRKPTLVKVYRRFLLNEDEEAFLRKVSRRYMPGTLERVLVSGRREARRAAALALGLLGPYSSNAVLGKALHDGDRGVRMIASNSIRKVWCRAGGPLFERELSEIVNLNNRQRYDDVIRAATKLVDKAPWFAEAWNQRAIALYSTSRYDESISDCRQVLELNAYHFAAAAGMGQCYLELDQATEALESFRRALKLNPDMESVRVQIAHLKRALEGN